MKKETKIKITIVRDGARRRCYGGGGSSSSGGFGDGQWLAILKRFSFALGFLFYLTWKPLPFYFYFYFIFNFELLLANTQKNQQMLHHFHVKQQCTNYTHSFCQPDGQITKRVK